MLDTLRKWFTFKTNGHEYSEQSEFEEAKVGFNKAIKDAEVVYGNSIRSSQELIRITEEAARLIKEG